MKKIVISAVITPSDDAVTMEDLKKALSHLGSPYFLHASEVKMASVVEGAETRVVWLYVSPDDSEPYIKVNAPGECDGVAVEDKEIESMQAHGVCTEFRAEYPRADKYGPPLYATDNDFAAGVVSEHGFSVDADNFEVCAEDRGDDGIEQFWLKIVLPV